MPVSSSTEHWIKQDALTINLNHFGDPDYLQVSILAGTVVMAFKKDVIGYNAAHNYRTWPLQAANTYLETSSAVNVYARLTRSEVNALALIVYDTVLRDIEGREISYDENGNELLGESDPSFFYVFVGQISESLDSNGNKKPRAWNRSLVYGTLDSSEQKNYAGLLWEMMFTPHFDNPLNPDELTWIEAKKHLGVSGGITMFVNNGKLNIPSIYDGLPIDNNTIYWENGILKAKGGGGIAESVSWTDITGKPEWLLDGKISYSEVEGTPDLSVYALNRSLSAYVTKTELSNLDYADKDWVIKKGYLTSIPSEYITESELTAKGYATASSVNTALGNKVEKVDGKGLSTEDFTTALKTKLEGLNNYNDTAISNAVTKLRSDFDALVKGDTSTAIDNFNEIIAFLDGVQDNQNLSSIIASIEQQIAAKYTKPSGGIPKSDLVQAVQASLGKADSALQSHQSIYTLTFQSGTFASGSFTANSGNKTINIPTTTSHVSEGSNLYFTNARAVSALGDTLKSYVTLSGSQTVSGEKNFTGELKVNGSPIVYDAAKKYWKLEGDLLITGGLTMYGSDSSFTPSTIMDAIAVDGTTISKDGGVLRVIVGGGGSISEITKQMVIDALGFTPISSSDIPTSLPNPHSLKFGSKLYDGSASKTILASDLGALTAHQTIYALTVKNSAGTTQLTYTPNSGTGSLTLTKAMVGLGNVDNLAASGYLTDLSSNTTNAVSITVGGTTKSITSATMKTSLGLGSLAYKSSLTASDIPNLDWSKITSGKPTTLSGYGITDAKIANGVITLGSSSITPLTNITSSLVTSALGYTPYDESNPKGFITSSALNGYATTSSVNTALNGKVDKVSGMGLSTEDFTTALKTKLEGLNNYNDTAINNAINKLRNDFDTLVDGDASEAIDTFNEIIAFLDGVQDNQDLASIIASIEQQIAAKYTKPSGGIPKGDLAQDVQTLLKKADSALQSYTETDPIFSASAAAGIKASDITNWNSKTSNVGTITEIKMNNASKGKSGVVDLGTVITAHQDISGKADKSSLATVATSGDYRDLINQPVIPIVPSSLKNPYLLKFGNKSYDGSSEQTITASDLGALTSHQDISGKLDKTEAASTYLPLSGGVMNGNVRINWASTSGSGIYGNDKNLFLIGDKLQRRSLSGTFYDIIDSGNYSSYALPLSGGTITGNLTWDKGTGLQSIFPAHIYRNLYDDAGNVYDNYYSMSGVYTNTFANLRVWDNTNRTLKILKFGGDGTFTWDGKTVIHSGNIGSQSVASATKAIQDSNGNIITSTYATKPELNEKANANGVFIMFHRKSDNFPVMVNPDKWPSYQSSGEIAEGVVIVEGGRMLVVAPTETSLYWSSAAVSGGGKTTADRQTVLHDFEGKSNTVSQITHAECSGESSASGYCYQYSRTNANGQGLIAGKWWLPSMGELMMIYANMRKINYALSLIEGATQLAETLYWTSTEYSATYAWGLYLNYGYADYYTKAAYQFRVRPVSAFYNAENTIRMPWDDITLSPKLSEFTSKLTNVASATKLATPRTLWGQSFDGSGNVDGSIYFRQGQAALYAKVSGIDGNLLFLQVNPEGHVLLGQQLAKNGKDALIYGNNIKLCYGTAASTSNTALTVNSSGNVGIGTTSPSEKLEVEGNSKANSFISTSSNGLRLAYGNYGTILRNDGSGFFILLTNSGGALDGSFNTLRPFKIDLATGDIQMESNVFITKSFKLSTRLRVNAREAEVSFGYLKSNIANASNVGIAHLGTNYGGTSDMTREDLDMTAISMYRGIVGMGKEYDYASLRAIYDAGVDLGLTKGLLIGSAKVLYANNELNISTSAYINGNILASGGVTMYSQRSLKDVVDEEGLTLEQLQTIKPTRYTWKDKRDDRIHFGGIADDVQKVLPEVIYKTSDGVLTMDYGNAAFAVATSLIKPVVDHEQRIKALEKENEELKQVIKRLRA